ncbi:MAG: HAMP domain-containing protein, partial [Deltaproteobacteria bacterium]|nr:HAMP domain-containing protein [Deltaproteobacteria bacterium]
MKMQISIRKKILLSITGCVICVSVAIGITSSRLMERFLFKQVSARLNDTAENLALKVNQFFVIRKKEISSLSKNKTVGIYLEEPDKIEIAQIQDLFLTLSDNFTELTLLNNTGMEIARVIEGRISVKLKKQGQMDFFVQAMGKESIFFGNVTHFGRKKDIDISRSVLSPYEEYIGVIVGKISHDKLKTVIKNSNIDKDFIVTIFDNQKRLLTSNDAKPISRDMFNRNIQAQKVLSASSSVDVLGWTVIVSMPYQYFARNIRTLEQSIFFIALFIVIFGIILSLLLSAKLSKPILMITEASKSISDGNFSSRIDVGSKDELGDLAVTFNKMTKEIADSTASRDEVNAVNQQLKAKENALRESQAKLKNDKDALELANQNISDLMQKAMTDVEARYENLDLLKCWEVKNCKEKDCPAYRSDDLRCWQTIGTCGSGKIQGNFSHKCADCTICEVYKHATKTPITNIAEKFNNLMNLL